MTIKIIGHNDPCPCGSGKEYQQCCLPREKNKTIGLSPISKLIQTAMEHHQAGRLPEAEAIYQQVLQVVPDHPDALHLLGVLANQTGKNVIAVELIRRAILVNPSSPMYNNLGNAL